MEIVKCVGVKKVYGEGEAQVEALRGIDLTVESGEFLAVAGASGSGKSTLLHILVWIKPRREKSLWAERTLAGFLPGKQPCTGEGKQGLSISSII